MFPNPMPDVCSTFSVAPTSPGPVQVTAGVMLDRKAVKTLHVSMEEVDGRVVIHVDMNHHHRHHGRSERVATWVSAKGGVTGDEPE